MLLENGADPSYVQHRLGHKDVTVTLKVYKHLTEKMTERGVEVLIRYNKLRKLKKAKK